MNKDHIAQAFGNAHHTYNQESPVQKWCAEKINAYVKALDLAEGSNCLEIGCGTGHLTELLVKETPSAHWTITDLSPNMLTACKERVGERPTYRVMDGEHPNIDGQYDLIVSSLAFQWFGDLTAAIDRLTSYLKPDGKLIFSTLGCSSFKEWRTVLEELSLPSGLHPYPDVPALTSSIPHGEFERREKSQPYEDGLAFLKALKAIGAQHPQKGYTPLSPGQLRKALRSFGDAPVTLTYDIIFARISKP